MNIHEKITVRQVGHLQELYRDTRSTKHKILQYILSNFYPINIIIIITTTTTTVVVIIIIIIINAITLRTFERNIHHDAWQPACRNSTLILLIRSDPTAFQEVGWTLLLRNSFEVRGSNAFENREYRCIVDSCPEIPY
jgi:hypothetical protein